MPIFTVNCEQTILQIWISSLHDEGMTGFKNISEYCTYLIKRLNRINELGAKLTLDDKMVIITNGLPESFSHFIDHCEVPSKGIETNDLHKLLDKYEKALERGQGLIEGKNCPLCKKDEELRNMTDEEFRNILDQGIT
jgi:hypothetical protein